MKTTAIVLTVFAPLMMLAGCLVSPEGMDVTVNAESSETAPRPVRTGDEPGTRGGPASVSELLELHDRALFERDGDLYEKLLDEEFEFFPKSQDLDELPWLPGDSWDRETEMGMIRNLFDSDYSRGEVPIQKIFFDAVVLTMRKVPGGVEVTLDADITLLVDPSSGYLAQTRLVFFVVPIGDSFRIRSITEREILARSVEGTSWGLLKALYR